MENEQKGGLFVLDEVSNGYGYVTHVAYAVIVNVRVGMPAGRTRLSVEPPGHVGDVLHVRNSVIDAWHRAGNVSGNTHMNRDATRAVIVRNVRFSGNYVGNGFKSVVSISESGCVPDEDFRLVASTRQAERKSGGSGRVDVCRYIEVFGEVALVCDCHAYVSAVALPDNGS